MSKKEGNFVTFANPLHATIRLVVNRKTVYDVEHIYLLKVKEKYFYPV